MGILKKDREKKNHTVVGKPMTKKDFIEMIKNSEESGEVDFNEGLKMIEERIVEYRKIKK